MQIINVITLKKGTIERIASFVMKNESKEELEQVAKAEADFRTQAKAIGATAEELADLEESGSDYYSNGDCIDEVTLVWSHEISETI